MPDCDSFRDWNDYYNNGDILYQNIAAGGTPVRAAHDIDCPIHHIEYWPDELNVFCAKRRASTPNDWIFGEDPGGWNILESQLNVQGGDKWIAACAFPDDRVHITQNPLG